MAAPTTPKAIPKRACDRQPSGPLRPVTLGSRLASGTCTSIKISSLVTDARRECLRFCSGAENTSTGPPAEGNMGAGTGATVGKILGIGQAMKSGIGTASMEIGSGVIVGAIAAVNAQLKEQNTVYADQMDALADWSRYRQNVHDAEMATINDEIDLLRDKIALEQQPFLDKQMAANEEYQKLQAEGNVADLYFAREREKAHTTGDKKRLEDLKLEEDSYRDNQRYRLDVLRAEMAVSKDQMDAVTDRHAAELTALQAEQAAKKDAWDAEQDAIKRRREALEATNKVQREAAAERLKEIAAEEKAALLANQTIQGLLDTISALQAKTAELEMIKTVSLIANTLSSAGMQIPQAVLAAFAALPREAGGMLDSVINALLAAYGRGLYGAAEGAVVTRPTMLMAGEGGEPEAILPLSSLRGLVDSVLSRVLGGRVGMPMPGAMLRAGGGSTFTQQRTYQLSASYAQVQSESSIMLDLQAMEMLAGARG